MIQAHCDKPIPYHLIDTVFQLSGGKYYRILDVRPYRETVAFVDNEEFPYPVVIEAVIS